MNFVAINPPSQKNNKTYPAFGKISSKCVFQLEMQTICFVDLRQYVNRLYARTSDLKAFVETCGNKCICSFSI